MKKKNRILLIVYVSVILFWIVNAYASAIGNEKQFEVGQVFLIGLETDIFFSRLVLLFILAAFVFFHTFAAVKSEKRDRILEKTENFLSSTINSSSDGMLIINLEGKIIRSNMQAVLLTGYSKEYLLDKPFDSILNFFSEQIGKKRSDIIDNIKAFNPLHIALSDGIDLVTKNNRIPVDCRFSPIKSDDEKIMGGLLLIRDLTKEKEKLERIAYKDNFFRNIFSNSNDGILVIDHNAKLVEWNPAMEKITGLKRNEVLEQFYWDVLYLILLPEKKSPETLAKLKNNIMNNMNNPDELNINNEMEIGFVDISGERKFALQQVFAINMKVGRWYGNIIHDITKFKQYSEKLKQSEEKFFKTFNLSPEPLIITRFSDGLIVDVNEGFVNTFGYTPEEVVNTSIRVDTFWVNMSDNKLMLEQIEKAGEIKDFEIPLYHKDRSIVYCSLSIKNHYCPIKIQK